MKTSYDKFVKMIQNILVTHVTKMAAVSIYGIYPLKIFSRTTVLPAKSDSDFMFGLQSNQGLIINISRVY